ncbi:MAG: immunoglobulin domain-containing protein, partial [Verrucomicrobia bacterium]|nr:immunoglobulin domain-containing protein [Verrucomicrobiota bacterium]
QPRHYLARLNADGTLDSAFNPGPDNSVSSLAIQDDGEILAGGGFTNVAGQTRVYVARLNNTEAAAQSLSNDGTTIRWLRGGASPEIWRTAFDYSSNGFTWTSLGNGARMAGGWHLDGLLLPPGGTLRARGHVTGGQYNASAWFVETMIGAPIFSALPSNQTNNAGTTAVFTVLAGGHGPLFYQWRKDGVALAESEMISGASTPTLTLTSVFKNDEGGYSVVVTNAEGSVTSTVATLAVLDPFITGPPASQQSYAGQTVAFSVTVAGTGPLSFHWWKDGAALQDGGNISGTITATLTVSNVLKSDEGGYGVVVANSYAAVTSAPASLILAPPPLVDALNASNLVWSTGGGALWTKETSVTHDGQAAAQSGMIADSQESWLETTVTGPGPLSFWWKVSSEADFDYLEFYINGVRQAARIAGEVDWQAQNYTLGAGFQVLHWRYVKDGTRSTGQDRGWVDQVSYTSPTGPPVILTQPASRTNNAATAATFSVVAQGADPLSYQWRQNGMALEDGESTYGVNTATLSLSWVFGGDAGGYDVVLSNGEGSVTSSVAVLTVLDPVITSQPVSQQPSLGGGVTFTVRAVGTALRYQWWKDGVALPQQTSAVLSLANLQGSDAGNYTVVVAGHYRSVTSAVALLTINLATLDTSFNPGAGSYVYALAVQPDGSSLVGGAFTTLAGQPRSRLGRLTADGTLDGGFNPGAGGYVSALTVQADGKILVGGGFTTLGGLLRTNIARLNGDGTPEIGFNPGGGSIVYAMVAQADGKILVGGYFTMFGGQPRTNIARLNGNGTLDSGFDPGASST